MILVCFSLVKIRLQRYFLFALLMLNVLDLTDNKVRENPPFSVSVYFAVIQPVNGTRCSFSLHLRKTSI